jgi:hypothetical protein
VAWRLLACPGMQPSAPAFADDIRSIAVHVWTSARFAAGMTILGSVFVFVQSVLAAEELAAVGARRVALLRDWFGAALGSEQ